MKKIATALAVLALGAIASPAHASSTPAQDVAHRGYLGWGAQENTHASMRHAVQAGYGGVEFDVRLTKDKHLVLMHDTTVDKTTTCAGAVSSFTWAVLAKCDASTPTVRATVPDYAGTVKYIGTLSKTINVYVHVKVRLDSKAATALVKEAKALSKGTTRVTFMLEDDADRKALIAAGWDGPRSRPEVMPFGLMVHTAADWKRVVSGAYHVAVPYGTSVTADQVERITDAQLVLFGMVGEPDTLADLQAAGVARFFI